ncbi:MAG: hypothetical protein LDL41_08915 [Coleofasciculus sp. S288]|nr:hypothetical protein [Coleofasciculus sp. S288]
MSFSTRLCLWTKESVAIAVRLTSVIAHMINSGARVEVMKSLADLMGHCPQIQQRIYFRAQIG